MQKTHGAVFCLPPASMQPYDNLKTVVDAVFVGKERRFNRRFLTLTINRWLACTPDSRREKGQVENQVGNIREWLFTPTPKFQDVAALNAWLAIRCLELIGRRHHQQTTLTIGRLLCRRTATYECGDC